MKFYISKPDDRDSMIVILARNGYTVRQGKEKKAGAKTASPFVEVIESGNRSTTPGSSD